MDNNNTNNNNSHDSNSKASPVTHRGRNTKIRTLQMISAMENNPLMMGSHLDLFNEAQQIKTAQPAHTLNITGEETTVIKRILLKQAISHEFDIFKQNPTIQILETTTFLAYLYHQFVSASIFQNNPSLVKDMNALLLFYPKLITLLRRATGRALNSNLVVSIYGCGILTQSEHEALNITTAFGQATKFDRKRRLELSAQLILHELESFGASNLSRALLINPLPPLYSTLFSALIEYCASILQENFQNPKIVQKYKGMLETTPLKSLYTALKMSHSVGAVSAIISILISRPFGFSSLLQKLFEIGIDLPKTQNQVKEYQKLLNNRPVSEKISNWVAKNYQSDQYEVLHEMDEKTLLTLVLSDPLTKPKFDDPEQAVQDLFDHDKFSVASGLLTFEIRNVEKMSLLDLLGDSEFVRLLKEVLPVLYEPLAKLLYYGNLSKVTEAFFNCLAECIQVAEKSWSSSKNEFDAYVQALAGFKRVLIEFLRDIAKADPTFGGIPETVLAFFKAFSTQRISLEAIIMKQDCQGQEAVLREVRETIDASRHHHLFDPPVPAISKLLDDFVNSLPIRQKRDTN